MAALQTTAVPMWGGAPGDPIAQGPHAIVFHGSSFCVSEPEGDILPGRPQGYFRHDTRLLSRWELLIDGRRPESLTRFSPSPAETRFIQRMPPRQGGSDTALLVERRRRISSRLTDEVQLRNLTASSVSVVVTLRVDGDFADVFAVKEGRVPVRRRTVSVRPTGSLVIRGELPEQGVKVSMSGASYGPDGLHAEVTLGAFGSTVLVAEARPTSPAGVGVRRLGAARSSTERRRSRLSTVDPEIGYVMERSLVDIDSLRITDPDDRASVAVAAGAPWFMALFGRDSLITAYMMLPVQRELAVGTLRMLAARQGTKVDVLSEEQPGRILHETRFTRDAGLSLGGSHIYYGSIDATPLFVVLLAELWRWGEPLADLEDLVASADRALEWTRTYGDPDRDGFVEYQRSSERGLVNQGWRDSWNGVTFADGRVAEAPIALCEVQGYVYAALRGRAEMARAAQDGRLARRLDDRAERLRDAFDKAFWLPDLGYYAMALDGQKRPVDSLTSSIGHLLWTGIVPEERAPGLADLLLSDEMFSGWGVRTLATSMAAYNPLSYHNGSVWPHDNAIVAHGLAKYGLRDAACAMAEAMFDVAVASGGRLPELFGGFSREEYPEPVPYPTACSPQAWAAGAPLLLLRAALGLEMDVPAQRATLAPALPEHLLPLSWSGLHPGKSVMDVAVSEEGRSRLFGLPRGFAVSR